MLISDFDGTISTERETEAAQDLVGDEMSLDGSDHDSQVFVDAAMESDSQSGGTDASFCEDPDLCQVQTSMIQVATMSSEEMVLVSDESGSAEPQSSPLDLEKLCSLLEKANEAGDCIKDKDVLLLLRATGAGKTTSLLYLAGTTFKAVEVDGFDHFELKPGK